MVPLWPPSSVTVLCVPLLACHVLLEIQGLLARQHCLLHYMLAAMCPEGAVLICNGNSHPPNHYASHPLAEYHHSFLLFFSELSSSRIVDG